MAKARLKAALVRMSAARVLTSPSSKNWRYRPDHERSGGEHLGDQHEHEEGGATWKAVARGVVGGGGGGEQDDSGRQPRHSERDLEPGLEAAVGDHLEEASGAASARGSSRGGVMRSSLSGFTAVSSMTGRATAGRSRAAPPHSRAPSVEGCLAGERSVRADEPSRLRLAPAHGAQVDGHRHQDQQHVHHAQGSGQTPTSRSGALEGDLVHVA